MRFSLHMDLDGQPGAATIHDVTTQLRMLADRIDELVLDDEPRPIPTGNTGRDAMPIADFNGYRIGQWKIAPSPRK